MSEQTPPNPNSNSKDAEVRARVTLEMFNALAGQANARGEQLPVIVREALAEYLAKRIEPAAAAGPRDSLLQALHDKPDVVQALVDLASVLRPEHAVTYRKVSKKDTRRKIRDAVRKRVEQVKASRPQPG